MVFGSSPYLNLDSNFVRIKVHLLFELLQTFEMMCEYVGSTLGRAMFLYNLNYGRTYNEHCSKILLIRSSTGERYSSLYSRERNG